MKESRHPGFRRDGRRKSGAWIVNRLDFGVCPICLSSDDLTDEHLPMKALGGRVMTKTCSECNNKLGSSAEEALRVLIEAEVVITAKSLSAGGPRGVRRATAAIRQVPFLPPTLHVRSADPEFLDAAEAGMPMDLSYRLLDRYSAGVAILKYSYLAACIWLREIPMSGHALAFREALVDAREGAVTDADLRAAIGRLVQTLVLVENASHQIGSVALLEPTETLPHWMLLLGGRLAVPWPFNDWDPSDRSDAHGN
jgi:hypothetical protein